MCWRAEREPESRGRAEVVGCDVGFGGSWASRSVGCDIVILLSGPVGPGPALGRSEGDMLSVLSVADFLRSPGGKNRSQAHAAQ